MDLNRKEKLKQRLQLVKQKLAHKESLDSIYNELCYLEEKNYTYSVYVDNPYLNWLYNTVKTRKRDGYQGMYEDFQIDVNASETEISAHEKSIEAVFENHWDKVSSLIGTNSEVVLCQLGGAPDLLMPLAAFLSAPALFFNNLEHWAISSDKKWVIEFIHEQKALRFIKLQNSVPSLTQWYQIEC